MNTDNRIGERGRQVTFKEALIVWLRVAALSFGGPAGQIAVMHRILVEEKKWVSENRFLHALNYCMVLPGPEAQQLATYIGWLLHGTRGGLVAGTLFVLPGFISILVLSILYAGFRDLTIVEALFFGIKAAVLAIVIQAVFKVGKRALNNGYMYAVSAAAFVSIFLFDVPFPVVIIGAGLIGLIGMRLDPDRFVVIKGHATPNQNDEAVGDGAHGGSPASLARLVRVVVVWSSLWLVPFAAIVFIAGPGNVFSQIGWFFSKLAVVTFGGAYSVLAYMAQEAVESYGWLAPGEMLDGLGMAETTPGPLIQVVQFVAFMGAFRDAGTLSPMVAGVLASVWATWVTFVPCFLWIFAGAPYVESLRQNQAVSAALSAITAAVVGVMLNLAVWFALHVAFTEVIEQRAMGMRLLIPAGDSIQVASIVITAGALAVLLMSRAGLLPVMAVSALLGMGYHYTFDLGT